MAAGPAARKNYAESARSGVHREGRRSGERPMPWVHSDRLAQRRTCQTAGSPCCEAWPAVIRTKSSLKRSGSANGRYVHTSRHVSRRWAVAADRTWRPSRSLTISSRLTWLATPRLLTRPWFASCSRAHLAQGVPNPSFHLTMRCWTESISALPKTMRSSPRSAARRVSTNVASALRMVKLKRRDRSSARRRSHTLRGARSVAEKKAPYGRRVSREPREAWTDDRRDFRKVAHVQDLHEVRDQSSASVCTPWLIGCDHAYDCWVTTCRRAHAHSGV